MSVNKENLKNLFPNPSSFAKFSDKRSWVKTLKKDTNEIIFCYRKENNKDAYPLILMHPIFANFVDDSLNMQISEKDCNFFLKLTSAMCGSFDCESDRMVKFHELFFEYSDLRFIRSKVGGCETDGTILRNDGTFLCNLEVKNEKGTGGGDPYMQNLAYFINFFDTEKNCPCFLLELCGPSFSVSGIVNTFESIICEPLTPSYSLFPVPLSHLNEGIIRMFSALVNALHKLSELKDSTLSTFPYCPLNNILIEEHLQNLTFSGKSDGKDVIIKYCKRYGREVHECLEKNGFSPKLLLVEDMKPNIKFVVMEKLNLRDLNDKDSVEADANRILEILHENNYVHGDLRFCNMKINVDTNRLTVLDFDWAGVNGRDVYPLFMNENIKWPEGAKSGNFLQFEHDKEFIDRLLSK